MTSVAVLLATYNGENYLLKQLESLSNQTYKDFTCYIHDDESTDGTVELCKSYCEAHKDRFVFLEYSEARGAKNNFLSLMKRVEADYYLFCDQDDFWEPEKIQIMIEKAQINDNNDSGILVFSDLKVVDENLEVLNNSFFGLTHVFPEKIDFKNSLIKGFIPGCCMLIDKKLMEKARCFLDSERIKMHDWWIVITAYLTGANIAYISKPLVLYRQHANNTIGVHDFSTIDRIKYNIKRLVNGELRKDKEEDLRTPRLQAQEAYDAGYGDKKKRVFLKKFCEIGTKCKLYRLFFYVFNFHHVYRFWWMLIWV